MYSYEDRGLAGDVQALREIEVISINHCVNVLSWVGTIGQQDKDEVGAIKFRGSTGVLANDARAGGHYMIHPLKWVESTVVC